MAIAGDPPKCEHCGGHHYPCPGDERPVRERMFPMQDGPPIPWWLGEVIYAGYSAIHGTDQSIERIAERGGFGWAEVAGLWGGLGVDGKSRYGSRARDAMDAKFPTRKD